MSSQERMLIAHLARRAGFGATPDELDRYVETGYEALVEEFLNPSDSQHTPDDLIYRRFVNLHNNQGPSAKYWGYRMISTTCPLEEKIALLWKGVFATGYVKTNHGKALMNQIGMFREYGLGRFDDLLVELSKDPAMLVWLDNCENHKEAINENYGREILELFSMGVGNYTEDDIKECARAFTGWTMRNAEYMAMMSQKDSIWPYGRINRHFEFRADDHDDGEKVFLGERGRFNGQDVIDIICRQPTTARFIARHLYNFFVADELPVPQWPHTPPRDPQAIDMMTDAYIRSDYSIKEMLRTMFNSDFFKSETARFARIKSPAEMVVGTMRLAGGVELPSEDTYAATATCVNMGQALMNPPSVEGWQGGREWINTGAYVHRVNFASRILNDPDRPGIRAIIDRIRDAASGGSIPPARLVDLCIEILGPLDVLESTRDGLVEYASTYGDLSFADRDSAAEADRAAVAVLQLLVTTQEYQMV